jgi:putative tricarboxylic transport membrane protein
LTPASDRSAKFEHLGFVVAIGCFVGWFLWNSASASSTFQNLILIGPMAVLGLAIVLFIVVQTLLDGDRIDEGPAGITTRLITGRTRDAVAVIIAFLLFVTALPFVGFDLATALFMAAVLIYLGERRVVWVLALSLGVAVVLTAGALATLTYPLPTAIMGRLWGLL